MNLFQNISQVFFFSGIHHKNKQCDTRKVIKTVKDILVNAKSYLFPPDVVVAEKVLQKHEKQQKYFKANGGWGDLRDRSLCMNMSQEINNS